MTERQTSFLAALIAERAERLARMAERCVGTTDVEAAKAAFLIRPEGVASLNVRQASEAIEFLLTLPRDPQAETASGATPDADAVPAGRYALTFEGQVRFFRVDRPTEGRWAGRTFVKEQASEEWFPVRGPRRGTVLAAIEAAGAREAMLQYGLLLGRCGNCGRTLTDPISRAMGIGPDCADRLGLDRSPYAEAARQETVTAVTLDPDDPGSQTVETDDEMEMEARVIASEERAFEIDYTPGPSSDTPTATLTRPRVEHVTRTRPQRNWREQATEARAQRAEREATGTVRYDSVLRQANAAIGGRVGPFTLYTGDETQAFANGVEAYLTGLSRFQADPMRRVLLTDRDGDTLADWDL